MRNLRNQEFTDTITGMITSEPDANFNQVLAIVKESLSQEEQTRLAIELISGSRYVEAQIVNELNDNNYEVARRDLVSVYQWVMDAYQVLLRGIRLVDNDQLRQWGGVRALIESCPMKVE